MAREKVQDLAVSDFATTEVVWAAPDDELGDVLGKMKEHDVHEIPVGRKGKLEGVVTLRELMKRKNLPPSTKVTTVAVRAPEIKPDTKLPAAAERVRLAEASRQVRAGDDAP